MAIEFSFLLMFAFSKKTFCNYYFFGVAALAAAVAAGEDGRGAGSGIENTAACCTPVMSAQVHGQTIPVTGKTLSSSHSFLRGSEPVDREVLDVCHFVVELHERLYGRLGKLCLHPPAEKAVAVVRFANNEPRAAGR